MVNFALFRLSTPLLVWLASGLVVAAAETVSLRSAAQVDGEGVFLSQVLDYGSNAPALRLCDAPAFGKSSMLSRAQVGELAKTAGLESPLTNWTGAEAVRISRRSRTLAEAEVLQMLTTSVQTQYAKDGGEVELRFPRPWAAPSIPDEPLTLKILDFPTSGIIPALILRFELETARGEHIGPWQAALQARVWREVWVSTAPLKRGELVRNAAVARERRDVVLTKEALADFNSDNSNLELAESVPAHAVLLARVLKTRPVVFRGQTVAASVQDGTLAITLKVEVLEDGTPGQFVRLRNPANRRDLRGKVLDEQHVLISL